MLSGAGNLNLGIGDAWVIASSLFWALHVLFVGKIADRIATPFLVACGQFSSAGIACLFWGADRDDYARRHPARGGADSLYRVHFGRFCLHRAGRRQRYAAAADAAIILSAKRCSQRSSDSCS